MGEAFQEYTVETEVIMNEQQRYQARIDWSFRQPGVGRFRSINGVLVFVSNDDKHVDNVTEQLSDIALG